MAVDPVRAKSLFLAAVDLADPAERAAYLGRECGTDAELRGRVEALLRAHETTGESNDTSTEPQAPDISAGEPTSGEPMVEPAPQTEASVPEESTTDQYEGAPAPDALIAGRYTLLDKIGEGGMGEVWVAKQSEPVKRKVALKLIKPGMDSRAVIRRFEQERQALALMDHPNIAKVFDAGTTGGKSEIRNPKKIRNSKSEIRKGTAKPRVAKA
jgi:serine/threonine-protein kinase